jgi:HEPN/RES N-terminal domain 1/RES domain
MAKRQMEEDEARGWSSVGEKWCCADHVEDEALEELIAVSATSNVCSYCGCEGDEPFAADVDLIVERIATSLPFEWAGADDEGVGWEGGYVDKTLDTWTLVTDGLDWPLNNSELISDVAAALPEIAWVRRDHYALSPSDRLLFGWDQFGQIVKHRSRYFFSDWGTESQTPFPDLDWVSPSELLSAIGEAVVVAGLVRELHPGNALYRARTHSHNEVLQGASQLGAPPAECVVSSSRMSPAGISMFYGALDPDTAAAEARSASPDDGALTLARFEPLRPIRVVDLSEQPEVPSLFDVERRELRHALIFLRRFVTEIAREFVRDERIHIEYVPTQIVTEWFATKFNAPSGGVHGLLYQSPRSPGGVNAALFN